MAHFKFSDAPNRAGASLETKTIAAWDGSYDAQALFLMEFDGDWVKGKVDGHDGPGPLVFFSKGRFRHVAGSDLKPFLAKLAKALGATAPTMSPDRAEELPFEVALLGVDLSRDPMDGFNGEPDGTPRPPRGGDVSYRETNAGTCVTRGSISSTRASARPPGHF